MRKKKRIRRMFLWLLATIVVLFALEKVVGPVIPSWRVERAIARFQTAPSQVHAARLVRLLEAHAATERQGKRALSLLLRPDIVMRETYPIGQIVMVHLEQPFAPDSDLILWQEETISIDGRKGPSRVSSAGPIDQRPCPAWLGVHQQPGTYPAQIHVQGTLGIERAGGGAVIVRYLHRILPWLVPRSTRGGWRPARTYEYDLTVATEVTIVAKDRAEQVAVTSSPDLDQAMRAAFSSASSRNCIAQYSTPSGDRWIRGFGQITYQNLPTAVAFKVAVDLPDGHRIEETTTGPKQVSARAGDSGVFTVYPSEFIRLEQPGRYDATLILTPAPDYAYRDPAIKTVWNGTLELPISFKIDANAPPGGPPPP
jgi:hypothetical protein